MLNGAEAGAGVRMAQLGGTGSVLVVKQDKRAKKLGYFRGPTFASIFVCNVCGELLGSNGKITCVAYW